MTAATTQPARRLRRTASWLLAMSLPVGVVAGAAAAHATAPDFQLVPGTATAVDHAGAVVVDGSGVVYVAETGKNVVKRLAPGASPVVVAGAESAPGVPADGKLATPTGLALSPDGKTLYIADPGNDVVAKVDATATNGTLTVVAGKVGLPGAPSNAAGADSRLNDPTGLAADAAGNLYIADTGNNQVEKLTPAGALSVFAGNGNAAAATPGPATASALKAPSAVTVDAVGNVLVADAGNRTVDKVDPASGLLSVVGSTGATGSPTALATDLSGAVYVADPTGGGLKKMTGGAVATVTLGAVSPDVPLGPVAAVATTLGGNLWLADATRVAPHESTVPKDAPRITSVPPTTAAVGKPFSFSFTATGVPTPQWSFVDAKGPEGLTIGAATGVLSGTPTKAGATTFTVRASNSKGHFDQVVTLTVGTLPAAPAAPTAVAGDGKAVVTWKAATSTGTTADVTGYVLTPFKDGVAQTPVEFTAAQTTTQIVTGLTNGAKHTFTLAAKNSFGTGAASAASAAVTPYPTLRKPVLDVPLSRLSGKDRLETAVNSSKASFPTTGSAGAVVVSAAYKYADALAGARLASATSAPLLLTESDKLTAAVGTEITRVLAPGGTIYVLGGSGTVSAAAETALTALSPNYTVKRLAGDDRYETAAKIAEEVAAQVPGTATAPIYLASGVNFPDGLAVSALAARTGGTVLLTDGDVLPAATKNHLQAEDSGATRVVPVGGAAAAAAASLPAAGGSAARAIVGVDRFDTAALVAREFTGGPVATKVVGVATGDNWPDALVGSAAVGLLGGPLLLTSGPDLGNSAQSALGALNAAKPLATGVVFGGEPSVPAKAYATFGKAIAQD
ncbi:cell wall-binding repeat-containing protein [Kineococcus sp. SYSU DK001]|uniref:cell wall-binding repeat-containing protein n=1 Tax=Kineococcus sp. SYSU DK001 TaxID=3383122 RepID=UPI003D7CF484